MAEETRTEVVKNAEVFWLHMDPADPDTYKEDIFWSVTVRTSDSAVKKQWEAQGLNPALKQDDDDNVYYQCTFRRNTVNSKGKDSKCPPCVNGKLRNVDPNSIGNGSICNINLFMRPNRETTGKWVAVLMGLQVVEHKVYVPSEGGPMFEECDTKTIQPERDEDPDDYAEDVNAGAY